MSTDPEYWFPAKSRGWGWGPPAVWQGRAVLAVFAVCVLAGAIELLPTHGPFVFVGYTAFLCLVLMGICWLKGEPPGRNRRPR